MKLPKFKKTRDSWNAAHYNRYQKTIYVDIFCIKAYNSLEHYFIVAHELAHHLLCESEDLYYNYSFKDLATLDFHIQHEELADLVARKIVSLFLNKTDLIKIDSLVKKRKRKFKYINEYFRVYSHIIRRVIPENKNKLVKFVKKYGVIK
jgi:Zn-dependent peptidase ImmA (M78 family)